MAPRGLRADPGLVPTKAEVCMEFGRKKCAATLRAAAAVLIGALLSGCGGNSGSGVQTPQNPATVTPPPSGTGTLTVAVADPEGRPLADALVTVSNTAQTRSVGDNRTGSNGLATIDRVPATVMVSVNHEFGEYYQNKDVSVAQQGVTFLAVKLQAQRPRPTVALLPVSISPGSVSADRSELTLEVTVVASAARPFAPAGYGDYSTRSTPSMALALDEWEAYGGRQCYVWLDGTHTVPLCGAPWGNRYTVSVEKFAYDPVGSVPILATQGPAASTMLVMDQSNRVAALDPGAKRSFAARQLIARAVTGSAQTLAVAGLAGGGNLAAALPEQPLWLPTGSGTVYSTDRAALEGAISTLEPLVGGSAPVFDALQTALTLTATHAPPGNPAVIAVLGGGDDGARSDSARHEALAALRRQRDDAGAQFIVIAGARDTDSAERLALADLAAALRAPAVSLGVSRRPLSGYYTQTWASGMYAAMDLAADLLDESPLPSLSASFRVKANQPDAFPAGATLHGAIFIETDICPMGCWEIPLEFAVEIP
jgi:hypothetical protein